jgi:putative nucleotidyltransferase with HDIG domain
MTAESVELVSLAPETPRILIVDGDSSTRELLKVTLENEGYEIQFVDSGEEALALVESNPPSLVILEARLPGRDGFDICSSLKKRPDPWPVPIIMISSNTQEDSRVRGLEAGAADFLAKPVYPRELLAKVFHCLTAAAEQDRLTRKTSALEAEAVRQRQSLDQTERRLKKQTFSIQTLMSMCQELAGSLKPEELMNTLMLMVLGQLGASSICLLLPADNTDTVLFPRARKGVPDKVLAGTCINTGDELGRCLRERNRAAEIELLMRRPGLKRPLEPFFNAGFQIIDPVVLKGELKLVVLVGSRVRGQPYERDDIELLDSLSRTAGVALENANLFRELQDTCLGIIRTLLSTLEAKDSYTRGHTERVAMYSVTIAEQLGIEGEELEAIRLGATLHDIGKLGVMDKVLTKPGALDKEERKHIMSHPARGAAILEGIRFLEPAIDMVRHHHECIDGTGYPDGLSGDEISIGARIVAVADAFDAITSGRVYMKAMKVQEAIESLRERANRQYDPKVVDALESVVTNGIVRVGV